MGPISRVEAEAISLEKNGKYVDRGLSSLRSVEMTGKIKSLDDR